MSTPSTPPSVHIAAAQSWTADLIALSPADGAKQVASADPTRSTVTVFTDPNSAGVLYLTPNPGQTRGGIRIVPGAGYEFRHAGAVYGRAEGGPVEVNVVTEFGVVC